MAGRCLLATAPSLQILRLNLQTLLHPAVIVDRSGVTPFDMQTTSGIFTQPNEPRFGTLQAPKYYFILAGSYNP